MEAQDGITVHPMRREAIFVPLAYVREVLTLPLTRCSQSALYF
jgi:hypothetical protein